MRFFAKCLINQKARLSIALRRFFSSAPCSSGNMDTGDLRATDPNCPPCPSHCLSRYLLTQNAVCAAFARASRHSARVLYKVPWPPSDVTR
jgi:hypothetical protein